jgi:hypothetical protein
LVDLFHFGGMLEPIARIEKCPESWAPQSYPEYFVTQSISTAIKESHYIITLQT